MRVSWVLLMSLLVALSGCGGPRRVSDATQKVGSGGRGGDVRLVPQSAHTHGAQVMALSDDETLLVSASDEIKIWEVATGALLRTIPIDGRERMLAARFTTDGNRVVAIGYDGKIRTWDVDSGALVSQAFVGTRVGKAVLSRDASTVLAYSELGVAQHQVATGKRVLAFGDKGSARALALTDGGKVVVVRRAGMEVWSAAAALERTLPFPSNVNVTAITSRGDTLVVAYGSPRKPPGIAAFDLRAGAPNADYSYAPPRDWEERRTSDAPDSPIAAMRIVADGSLVTVTGDRLVIRHPAGAVDLAREGRSASSHVYTAAITADGGAALLSGAEGIGLRRSDGASAESRMFGVKVADGIASELDVSRDGKRAAFFATPTVWDLETLRLVGRLPGASQPVAFAADGGHLLAAVSRYRSLPSSPGAGFGVWDVATDKVKPFDRGHPEMLAHSADGTRFFVGFAHVGDAPVGQCDDDGNCPLAPPEAAAEIIDVATGKTLRTFQIPNANLVRSATFLANGKVAFVDVRNTAFLADPATGTLKRWPVVDGGTFLPDGTMMVGRADGAAAVLDLETGATTRTWAGKGEPIGATDDGAAVLSKRADGSAMLWKASSGEVLHTYPAFVGTHARFALGGAYFVAIAPDQARVYRVADGRYVSLVASATDWLVVDENGYFDASSRGGELVAAVRGRHAYRIDQLAVRNNRPDLVLASVGLGSAPLLAHLRARHELRLARLGFTEGQLDGALESAPTASIGEVKTSGKTADVSFSLATRSGSLRSYNVFVNDVPLFGSGKRVSGSTATLRERVELGAGRNKIEVSTTTDAGVESLRAFQVVSYAEKPTGDLYFLAFGVSKYKDARLDLAYADKDALDLAEIFKGMKGKFAEVRTKALVNEAVTAASIRDAGQFLAKAKVDDTVVLFVAGHGVHTRDAAAEYYYATHDVDPKRLRETGASFDAFEALLRDIAPRKKLFLMDTCESGERDGAAIAPMARNARGMRERSVRGLVLDAAPTAPTVTAAPLAFLLDRDRFIYNDLARRTGTVVLSSSRGSESSFEDDAWQNGAFTAELKLALTSRVADTNNDGVVSVQELRDYVSSAVAKRTEDKQHPVVDRDNLEAKFTLPRTGAK